MSEFLNILTKMTETRKARQLWTSAHKDWVIDTAYVFDREWPIEIAVAHPDYNYGNWIIIDFAENEEEARLKHRLWEDNLFGELEPLFLYDISEDREYERKK